MVFTIDMAPQVALPEMLTASTAVILSSRGDHLLIDLDPPRVIMPLALEYLFAGSLAMQ